MPGGGGGVAQCGVVVVWHSVVGGGVAQCWVVVVGGSVVGGGVAV